MQGRNKASHLQRATHPKLELLDEQMYIASKPLHLIACPGRQSKHCATTHSEAPFSNLFHPNPSKSQGTNEWATNKNIQLNCNLHISVIIPMCLCHRGENEQRTTELGRTAVHKTSHLQRATHPKLELLDGQTDIAKADLHLIASLGERSEHCTSKNESHCLAMCSTKCQQDKPQTSGLLIRTSS